MALPAIRAGVIPLATLLSINQMRVLHDMNAIIGEISSLTSNEFLSLTDALSEGMPGLESYFNVTLNESNSFSLKAELPLLAEALKKVHERQPDIQSFHKHLVAARLRRRESILQSVTDGMFSSPFLVPLSSLHTCDPSHWHTVFSLDSEDPRNPLNSFFGDFAQQDASMDSTGNADDTQASNYSTSPTAGGADGAGSGLENISTGRKGTDTTDLSEEGNEWIGHLMEIVLHYFAPGMLGLLLVLATLCAFWLLSQFVGCILNTLGCDRCSWCGLEVCRRLIGSEKKYQMDGQIMGSDGVHGAGTFRGRNSKLNQSGMELGFGQMGMMGPGQRVGGRMNELDDENEMQIGGDLMGGMEDDDMKTETVASSSLQSSEVSMAEMKQSSYESDAQFGKQRMNKFERDDLMMEQKEYKGEMGQMRDMGQMGDETGQWEYEEAREMKRDPCGCECKVDHRRIPIALLPLLLFCAYFSWVKIRKGTL